MDTIREFSGKKIGPSEIEIIKWALNTYPGLSRKELASTICEFLDWNTVAGNAKTPQCVKCLEKLEAEGHISLPPLKVNTSGRKEIIPNDAPDPKEEISTCGEIRLEIARPGETQRRWKAYVERYHTLGYRREFGSRLQYFIVSEGEELGCIQFSASAWALESRDLWIGWDMADRKARLHLIVNNSRFLIFPWVRIKNLASRALSLAARQIQTDWLREYCYAPVLLETFVDITKYKGTCYKAANWTLLGQTKGRGRMDRENEYALTTKAIYVYPLQKDFKAVLLGKNPWKEAKYE